MRRFDFGFLFFVYFFRSYFFRNGFPNSLIVNSRSNCLFGQRKFFELYVRTCPAMFFFVSSSDSFSFYICSRSKAKKVTFSELLLPLTNGACARDVTSHSLCKNFLRDILVTSDLPHSIKCLLHFKT